MASLLLKLLDHLFFLRPLLLAPAATMFLLGRDAGAARAASLGGAAPSASPLQTAAVAAALASALVATHVANQLADEASDRVNGKLPYLALGLVSRRAARGLLASALALFALVLSLVPDPLIPIALGGLVLGLAYATPPSLLKARAGWDLAANAVGYGGIAYGLGFGTAAPLDPAALARGAAPWVLAVGAVFAATTVVDHPGDAAAAQDTLAVRLGPDRARVLAPALLVAAILVALWTGGRTALLLAAASLPAAVLPLIRPSRTADHLAFQIGAAIPALYAAARHPLFGAVLLAAACGARAYHASRFGARYPALGAHRRIVSVRVFEGGADRGDPASPSRVDGGRSRRRVARGGAQDLRAARTTNAV